MALRPVTFLQEVRKQKEKNKATAKEALDLFKWRIEEDFIQKGVGERLSPLEKAEYVRKQKEKRTKAYKVLFRAFSAHGVTASVSQGVAVAMVEKGSFIRYWSREFTRQKIATLADIKPSTIETFMKMLLVIRDMYASDDSDDIAHLLPILQVVEVVIDVIFSQPAKKAQ